MPGVNGRIDHMDINLKDNVVYVAALGNNTLEVADLKSKKIIHSITGLSEPQGVGYIPQTQEIFVANGGNGECYFYNAHTYQKLAAILLGNDADDVRVDAAAGRIYVGYGNGGIAVIDAVNHKLADDVKLPGHPEAFAIDKQVNRLFVNVPDAGMIAVIDLATLKIIEEWANSNANANFPMALDTQRHRVIVGYRHSPQIKIYDGKQGSLIGSYPMAGDADDLYVDDERAFVYASNGDGHINIFRQLDGDNYKQVANIVIRSGARTSLFVPSLKLFIVAARATAGKGAALMLYSTSSNK